MIIGREKEKETLNRLFHSNKSEFLAVYGRRRVGKTFLITEFFKDKGIFFEVTGLPHAHKDEDLMNFHREFVRYLKKKIRKNHQKIGLRLFIDYR